MQEVIKKIYEYSLEEIMGERFGRYSKTIIQDRAIPDVRDGLKPVQRRILYAMYKDHNTVDKPYRKCAKTVGNVMGFYHPHGDSSIYEAMVRMSQWWKQNAILIDMHGNNGSMDGDGAAAMRYTEARLSKISNELLKDIEKETVTWAPNYDDSLLEPTVLPAKYPNLLVNGSTGISAGYATNIPPHNLGEVIDATIKRIDSPNCTLDTIMKIVQGPDFPTGGIVEGIDGIRSAFETGRGRVMIRSKIDFVKNKSKEQIVITEIPFDVNKANLVKKIEDLKIDKKIEGISEVRDETDRDGLRIVIDLKKDASREFVVNYLLKNTELQISYNYNMVSIVNRRPMTLGIIPILDAYIKHQKEVITKRTQFDLSVAKKRVHIVEGLVKAISILDEVVATIRKSKNKADAKNNLVIEYAFTEEQAEAIVMLQLYKLTNTDVTALLEEQQKLLLIIKGLEAILGDPEKLKSVMKEELRKIKKEYATPRKTVIKEEITEIKLDTKEMIPKEDVVVVVTHDGYVKRVSKRSYAMAEGETTLKDGDYVIGKYQMNTLNTVLLFTNLGNYLFVPVHEIPDLKWKELGKHISNVIKLSSEETIIASIPVFDFKAPQVITTVSKHGMIKRSELKDFEVQRYSKPMTCMKLKAGDELVAVSNSSHSEIFLTTKFGYALWYGIYEVPITGVKAGGVKAMTLKNDEIVGAHLFDGSIEYLTVFTEKNTAKRIKLSEFDKTTRARRGIQIVRDVKTNPYYIRNTFMITTKDELGMIVKNECQTHKITEFPIADRYSTGTTFTKDVIDHIFEISHYIDQETLEQDTKVDVPVKEVSLKEIDERMMTIDDFLDDFHTKEE